jgi:hypothetical protein
LFSFIPESCLLKYAGLLVLHVGLYGYANRPLATRGFNMRLAIRFRPIHSFGDARGQILKYITIVYLYIATSHIKYLILSVDRIKESHFLDLNSPLIVRSILESVIGFQKVNYIYYNSNEY